MDAPRTLVAASERRRKISASRSHTEHANRRRRRPHRRAVAHRQRRARNRRCLRDHPRSPCPFRRRSGSRRRRGRRRRPRLDAPQGSRLETAVRARVEDRQQVLVEEQHERLALRIAEPGIELDHLGTVCGEHQPWVEHALERRPLLPHARDRRSHDLAIDPLEQRRGIPGTGQKAPIPPVLGPRSPS